MIIMQCSNEALVRLFYNLSSSSFLLLLFLYSSSILLAKFLYFIGSYPLINRSQDAYEYTMFSDEEEIEEEEEYGGERYNYSPNFMANDHLVADIIHGGESLIFLSDNNGFNHRTVNDDGGDADESMMNPHDGDDYDDDESMLNPRDGDDYDDDESMMNPHDGDDYNDDESMMNPRDGDDDDDDESIMNPRDGDDEESMMEHHDDGDGDGDDQLTSDRDQEHGSYSTEQLSAHDSSPCSDSEHHRDHDNDRDETDSLDEYEEIIAEDGPTPTPAPIDSQVPTDHVGKQRAETDDDKYFVMGQTKLEESKKLLVHEKDTIDEDIFYGDSCTNGSTSKSSSEWRSSINCRDSGTDDPFSSSSRGSCPKWESYTVYQKYDEEILFLHRVSAQKLQEIESLRSIQACPRSISERIVHKFATMNKRPSDIKRTYYELEASYVAQICLTWEALNWNYKNFERKRAARKDFDCPAGIAQQFQQFQVLLQRYNESEPYEQGRRPEVYARIRLIAPKLLLVPEYRDYEDDQKDEGFGSRISADSFLVIIEDGIQTFMNFLKADKETPYQIIKALFGRKRKGLVDPTLVQLVRKVNAKKKMKLKDLRRAHKCIRKRKPKVEKMEILMSLIDLKVVSRVLRMCDLSEQQLHWCEEKMRKVKILEGGLQRDFSPLFFPAH